MQHCQQAPVSNEFSTAVLADSIAVIWGGGVEKRYLFSIKLTPGPVMATLCHSIIWSGGPFPSLTLPVLFITSFKSRMYCNFANASIS